MLQRIYGTAWETPEQLAEHARLKAEAVPCPTPPHPLTSPPNSDT